MFWSDPEESWARHAWHAIQQTRQLAVQKGREYRMELSFSPDGSLRILGSGPVEPARAGKGRV